MSNKSMHSKIYSNQVQKDPSDSNNCKNCVTEKDFESHLE